MNENTGLLRSLEVDELPPSKVDLAQAVRSGRRRQRVRAAAIGGVTAVALLSSVAVVNQAVNASRTEPGGGGSGSPGTTAPAAPPLGRCTVADLTLPGAPAQFVAPATDPSGRITVVAEDSSGQTFLRYTDGVPERITGVPAGGANVRAVNSSGDFIGASGYKPAFVYRGGAFNLIPLPSAVSAVSPIALNDHGDAVLDLTYWADPSVEKVRVAVWRAGSTGPVVVLSAPDGWSARAVGISEDGGTVVGHLEKDRVEQHGSPAAGADEVVPIVWGPDGTRRELPTPAWDPKPIMQAVVGDWVLGRQTRWNTRTGTVDQIRGLNASRIDRFGRVFGEQLDAQQQPHPAVWVNGTVQLLPTFPGKPYGMMGSVSSDGKRITSVLQESNPPNPRPAVWTCK
jgi:hypothetical protein